MNIGPLLARLRELELDLAAEYRATGERHAADHDVHHQCRAFATQCEQRAARLEPHAERYRGDAAGESWGTLLDGARREGSTLLSRSPKGPLLLLTDLGNLFLAAEGVDIAWVMAGQAARALRDAELLELTTECHEEALAEVKWLVTRIKVGAPQALTS